MTQTETDATLGRIIFTDNAIQKMKKWGLHTHHIKDTLKHGFNVKPLIPGMHQKHYRHEGEKEIDCLFTLEDKAGKPLGAIMVISCWARNVL